MTARNLKDTFSVAGTPTTTEEGVLWTPSTGSSWNNVGGKLSKVTTNGIWDSIVSDGGVSDGYVDGIVTSANTWFVGFAGRWLDSGNFWGGFWYLGSTAYIYKWVNGTANSVIASAAPGSQAVAGDRIGMLIVGDKITTYINGVVSVTATDPWPTGTSALNNPAQHMATKWGPLDYYAAGGYDCFSDFAFKPRLLKGYDTGAYKPGLAKVWDGTKWVPRSARRYSGGQWI